MTLRSISTLVSAILILAACQSDNWGTDQTVGTLGGGAAGGVVGSQLGKGNGKLATTGLGVLLGAWAGNEIGASMDQSDKMRDQMAERRAYTAPVGQQVTWANPDSGNGGTILPVRDGYNNSGAYCRDFQQTVTIGGQQRQGFGKACQQPDGTWKIVQ